MQDCDIMMLWNIRKASEFLNKSVRWIHYQLHIPANQGGSIPHVRIGRSLRFVPEVMREWVSLGCPPAEVVKSDLRRRRA